jgi:hypothetical protein
MKEDEYLLISPLKLGYTKNSTYKDPDRYTRDVNKLLKKLSKKKKSKIKVIFGHKVPYGVHRHFDRQPRYFTFFREPVERTISTYNYKRASYLDKIKNNKKVYSGLKKTILLDGRIPSFVEWLNKIYDQKGEKPFLTIYEFLTSLYYLKNGKFSNSLINDALDKFFFIGTTDNFGEDSLYIYEKLGINKYFTDQNVARKAFTPKRSKSLLRLLKDKNKEDIIIYNAAIEKSKKLKNELEDYNTSIKRAKIKRRLSILFTQLVYAPKDALGLVKLVLQGKTDRIYAKKKWDI